MYVLHKYIKSYSIISYCEAICITYSILTPDLNSTYLEQTNMHFFCLCLLLISFFYKKM